MTQSSQLKTRPVFAVRALQAAAVLAGSLAVASQLALAQTSSNNDGGALSQTPLFVSQTLPPLNMLVMGRDHKLYYEAYNDASDLDGDGVIDVGYKPDKIAAYYGYFNSKVCYVYADGVFSPSSVAGGNNGKQCSGKWSGDFLNYLATSRMDALRRVLYGGYRVEDTVNRTVLQAAYVPRDAHTWGKAYDPARDKYNISDYAPLAVPSRGFRHLFAVTTRSEDESVIPELRVLNDSRKQVWDWVSKEGFAGQDTCAGGSCTATGSSQYEMLTAEMFKDLTITTWKQSPNRRNTPNNAAEMVQHFSDNKTSDNLCGSGPIAVINVTGGNNNPFQTKTGCTGDNYITEMVGKIVIPAAGKYNFAIDGDDAVEVAIWDGGTENKWGWYGGHGNNRSQDGLKSHSKEITFSTPGEKRVIFRHVESGGDDNWGLAMLVEYKASTFTNYNVRVVACSNSDATLRESSCKAYPNDGVKPVYKPTGLLHDFGENDKMHFGLLTGSYQKNIAGGTLRSNIASFKQEINPTTGVFKTDVNGIVANIDRQRVIGYVADAGKNPDNGRYSDCSWITDKSISKLDDPSKCAMWGNPISEMMFETMRYFSGATAAHKTYDYTYKGSKDEGRKLSKPDWIPPYLTKKEGGAEYKHCARPVMTVLSDINPSYDGKLPGSQYGSIDAAASRLNGFNASTEVTAIGAAEGIHGKNYFIGQSKADDADQAPTVKTVTDLSWARGLSPQEPSKEGTYYSAGVARFGANNQIFGPTASTIKSAMWTYSVALASPLPEIRFPVGGNKHVTIAPFAKSVTGGGVDNTKFTPTNQIVDYYVDRIANTGEADRDVTVNEGRPYAEFRINYEDVEQGADHDMDAISRYVVQLQANNTVKIDMTSEYAAGGYGQHMGYVISGTTKDGMYLEVRDKDTNSVHYAYNTPPGQDPGYCKSLVGASNDKIVACRDLPLVASRTFTVSGSTADSGSFLKDPLWYAAKYGVPGRDTTKIEKDPDNYFLVTNATTLKDQLTKAFNDILQKTTSVTAASVSMPSANLLNGADLYRTIFEVDYWSGDVVRESLTKQGKTQLWSAAEKLAARAPADRKIYYPSKSGTAWSLKAFTYSEISNDAPWLAALNKLPSAVTADNKAEARVAFLRGEQNDALRERRKLLNDKPNVLGDIINSSLVRVKGGRYLAGPADRLEGTKKYAAFAANQASNDVPEMLYVGSNDGMLHGFNASTGDEVFAYVPSGVRDYLSVLTTPKYGTAAGLTHRYFVDGTPVVTDVYFGAEWHKVLIGSTGAGAKQIFALDITNPASPKLLWEFSAAQSTTAANMGYSVPQPTVARLNDTSAANGKWVVLVPNGYQGLNSGVGQASLFVLDVANGAVIKEFVLSDDSVTDADKVRAGAIGNGLSRVAAIDNNSDGKIDMAYAGDLLGTVWRFDFSSGTASDWTAQRFFVAKDGTTANARQPITVAPYVVKHPSGKGDIVTVGTGRFIAETDKIDKQVQTVYGVWDRYSAPGATAPSPLPTWGKTRSNLQAQEFKTANMATGNFSLTTNKVEWYDKDARGTADSDVKKWGWYVDLPRAGEKLIYDMSLYGRGLVFSTVRSAEDACEADIASTIYAIDPNSGGKTDYVVFDMNNDGVFDGKDNDAGGAVAGTETGPGKQAIRGAIVFDPTGKGGRSIADGLDLGRQSWRRQPVNTSGK